jgi:hypothetical protein
MSHQAGSFRLPSEEVQGDDDRNDGESNEERSLLTAYSENGTGIQYEMQIQHPSGNQDDTLMWRYWIETRIFNQCMACQ